MSSNDKRTPGQQQPQRPQTPADNQNRDKSRQQPGTPKDSKLNPSHGQNPSKDHDKSR